MKRAAVFAALVLVSALSAAAGRCPPCRKKACLPTPSCRGEVIKDACDCCDICAKVKSLLLTHAEPSPEPPPTKTADFCGVVWRNDRAFGSEGKALNTAFLT
ncbi:hypothetical protein Bbelb_372040 [Branchiostoma belcheri]|nr:hypothetical protein Bbelb_372040 [Branchiostoma belcheri]